MMQAATIETESTPEHNNTVPKDGEIYVVINRDLKANAFDGDRITTAISKAWLAHNGKDPSVTAVAELKPVEKRKIARVKEAVVQSLQNRYPSGGVLYIEDIQNEVVKQLVSLNHLYIAKTYSDYRDKRNQERAEERLISGSKFPEIRIETPTGMLAVDWDAVELEIQEACDNLADVSAKQVLTRFSQSVHDEMPQESFFKALVNSASAYIDTEPNYQYVSGRLLLARIRREVAEKLQVQVLGQSVTISTQATLESSYDAFLKTAIHHGIEVGQLNPELASFDLDYLGRCLRHELDFKFDLPGMKTIYDRYLLRHDGTIYELPQVFFMRVAMGLALNEEHREEAASQFYALLANFDFMSSTPTLFNSGTVRSQLSSCYLSTVTDDLESIMEAIKTNALLAKWAGGLGNDWTPIRSNNAYIRGTNGVSKGVVPFLKMVDSGAIAVNQGGKRKGAVCVYLENWHLDFEAFLELRKSTGDDRLRTHDIDTAAWIPDLFMKRVSEQKHWTLFNPGDVPDLHDLYGKDFERRYEEYERQTETGELKLFKRVAATKLWQSMLTALLETGHPWITFKDPANIRSPQRHVGVVHSSNLCTEITLNTATDEIAVCNLGSVNLAAHIDENGYLDDAKLKATVQLAIRMLDNVIDINYYAVQEAENSNFKHRPIGLGLMGFHDALLRKRIPYSSMQAVEFADEITEKISYYAIEASTDLATERGAYQSFQGSLWSKGILPIDSLHLLAEERRDETSPYLDIDTTERLDWETLRQKVTSQGMRNSNVMAIAPTATIGLICGVTSSIEPIFSNFFAKENLSGNFIFLNHYLVKDLKNLDMWNEQVASIIKRNRGELHDIEGIPEDIKLLYQGAWEIEPMWLVEAGARRQKWIDQSQSLNIYIQPPKKGKVHGKVLDQTYGIAWERGLKTTYYLRTRAASDVERIEIEDGELNSVIPNAQQASSPNGTSQLNGHSMTHLNGESVASLPTAETQDDTICLMDDPTCESCQ